MTTPHGVSQPTHPGSMSHGLAWSVVVVKSVDPARNIAVVQDQLTKTFHMPLNSLRAKGLPPAVDEQWLISREYGPWAFVLLLNGRPEGETVPMANVEKLPEIDAYVDRLGGAQNDREQFRDAISTCLRREATTAIPVVVDRLYTWRTYTARELRIDALQMGIGTTRVGGTHMVGFYTGQYISTLKLFWFTTNFSGIGEVSANFGLRVIPANQQVVFFSLVTGAPTTMPTLLGPPSVAHSELINPGVGRYSSQHLNGITLPPTTLDLDADGFPNAITAWASLSEY